MELNQTGIKVKLIDEDGNAFHILGKVVNALKRNKYSKEFVDEYYKQATSKDYNHLLCVTSEVVEII